MSDSVQSGAITGGLALRADVDVSVSAGGTVPSRKGRPFLTDWRPGGMRAPSGESTAHNARPPANTPTSSRLIRHQVRGRADGYPQDALDGAVLAPEYAAEQVPARDVAEPGDAPVATGVGAEAGDEAGALPSRSTAKELVFRPAPPCQSSSPASTSIRNQLLLVFCNRGPPVTNALCAGNAAHRCVDGPGGQERSNYGLVFHGQGPARARSEASAAAATSCRKRSWYCGPGDFAGRLARGLLVLRWQARHMSSSGFH
jgi:hypothetical protein